MDAFITALGNRAFRLERAALNAAIFDSMSVGMARRIASSGDPPDREHTISTLRSLLENADYLEAISRSTADERSVSIRMAKAVERFAAL